MAGKQDFGKGVPKILENWAARLVNRISEKLGSVLKAIRKSVNLSLIYP
jgi:hypothetical protein